MRNFFDTVVEFLSELILPYAITDEGTVYAGIRILRFIVLQLMMSDRTLGFTILVGPVNFGVAITVIA